MGSDPLTRSYKPFFRHFLDADPDRLHFAAHSHHYWPDVSFQAQQQAWLDAARLADGKWETIFEEVLPRARGHIARILGLADPTTIAFAVNTHELVTRIFSCFPDSRQVRVLTTGSEFHSFSRQSRRWEESGRIDCTRIETAPFETFEARFLEAARSGRFDLVYLSQVFFDSGFVCQRLEELARATPDATWIVIDGYHGFMALPTDLHGIESRCFYLAGGYKYAMSGEGICFLHCPPAYGDRPSNTGWVASFGALEKGIGPDDVPYATDGFRFFGATFDPSGAYRFGAVMDLLVREGVTVDAIHGKVEGLQRRFLDRLPTGIDGLSPACLIPAINSPGPRGHFLTFESEHAEEVYRRFRRVGVVTDYRGDRLRLGFALYHDESDVDELCRRIDRIASGTR
ncbi:MAG: aminotransferase class V-fold PLP-dependent enzyme [Candidatus Eisenbacteria bacterium]|uniref:Aminotransferase class V-fold PLP-dependent enzyme n=1 Tax=Eiseniibacteriota bacterium TaxID=2212470 RepID=A0A956LZM7_UNCEI|nr:aminotransferase class V-fold PLP-dependent enzyme [Candidatus Eisenbacteria bacterium]